MSGCQAVARVAYVFLRKSKRQPIIPSKFEILLTSTEDTTSKQPLRSRVRGSGSSIHFRFDQHPFWKRGGEASSDSIDCKKIVKIPIVDRWFVYDNERGGRGKKAWKVNMASR